VAGLIAQGSSNAEISRGLRVSEKTVEGHLTRIYRKLELHSRTELAALGADGPEPSVGP
jgi:DNA-binding CsgD family transcriptional regulator